MGATKALCLSSVSLSAAVICLAYAMSYSTWTEFHLDQMTYTKVSFSPTGYCFFQSNVEIACFSYEKEIHHSGNSSEYWQLVGYSSTSWCQSRQEIVASKSATPSNYSLGFGSMWHQWTERVLCNTMSQTCFAFMLVTIGFSALALVLLVITISSWKKCRSAHWLGAMIRASCITACFTLGLAIGSWAVYSQSYINFTADDLVRKDFGEAFYTLGYAFLALLLASLSTNCITKHQLLQRATQVQQQRYQRLHQIQTSPSGKDLTPLDCPASYVV